MDTLSTKHINRPIPPRSEVIRAYMKGVLMKIFLDEDFYIEQKDTCYSLHELRKSYGTGNNKTDMPRIVDKELCFPNTIPQAINIYINRFRVKKDTENFEGSLEDYVKRIENIMKTMEDNVIRKVGA